MGNGDCFFSPIQVEIGKYFLHEFQGALVYLKIILTTSLNIARRLDIFQKKESSKKKCGNSLEEISLQLLFPIQWRFVFSFECRRKQSGVLWYCPTHRSEYSIQSRKGGLWGGVWQLGAPPDLQTPLYFSQDLQQSRDPSILPQIHRSIPYISLRISRPLDLHSICFPPRPFLICSSKWYWQCLE